MDGFRSALRERGLDVRTEDLLHADWTHGGAAAATLTLLDADERPSALFACSDTMALGALEAARQRGLAVPQELSVIGFDDAPEARWTTPQLTTIRQPVAEMGAAALRMLLRLRSGVHALEEGGHTLREELATRLMARDSTARMGAGDPDERGKGAG